ncbi:hypothetical protein PHMEG_00012170, partial [Phytophthora megakarya]
PSSNENLLGSVHPDIKRDCNVSITGLNFQSLSRTRGGSLSMKCRSYKIEVQRLCAINLPKIPAGMAPSSVIAQC